MNQFLKVFFYFIFSGTYFCLYVVSFFGGGVGCKTFAGFSRFKNINVNKFHIIPRHWQDVGIIHSPMKTCTCLSCINIIADDTFWWVLCRNGWVCNRSSLVFLCFFCFFVCLFSSKYSRETQQTLHIIFFVWKHQKQVARHLADIFKSIC